MRQKELSLTNFSEHHFLNRHLIFSKHMLARHFNQPKYSLGVEENCYLLQTIRLNGCSVSKPAERQFSCPPTTSRILLSFIMITILCDNIWKKLCPGSGICLLRFRKKAR